MKKLLIPKALKTEFTTVEDIWAGSGETRRVDALLLSWIKYEKQLRRLFSFFIFQHPDITEASLDEVISAFARHKGLYPETFISAIEELGIPSIPTILGERYQTMWPEISRIKKYRNKLIHGQLTGETIKSPTLEQDVIYIIDWVAAVAQAAEKAFGYDGLQRNTYRAAKNIIHIHVQDYPFSNLSELKVWIHKLK